MRGLLFEEATDINFFVGQSNEPGASESGSCPLTLISRCSLIDRTFRVPEKDGQTHQVKLFLERRFL